MELKEKFLDFVYCFMGSGMLTNTYDERIAEWNAKKCEIIADDFAIDFLEWCGKNEFTMFGDGNWRTGLGLWFNTKELLEIYKKEKGL
jgi:hypothetical protein